MESWERKKKDLNNGLERKKDTERQNFSLLFLIFKKEKTH